MSGSIAIPYMTPTSCKPLFDNFEKVKITSGLLDGIC